jgi:hypothetical protein
MANIKILQLSLMMTMLILDGDLGKQKLPLPLRIRSGRRIRLGSMREEGGSEGGTGGGEGTIVASGDGLMPVVMAAPYIEPRVGGC